MMPDTDDAPEIEPAAPETDPAMMDEELPEEELPEETLEPDPALEEQMLADTATADAAELDTPAPAIWANEEPAPENMPESEGDAPELRGWLDSDALAGIVSEVDPAGLECHPLSELLPLMSTAEFTRMKDSIEFDGQQVPAVLFEGQILDGRNRCRACVELRLSLRVQTFGGTQDQALMYVIAANQHRRELSKSQRAAVAVGLVSQLSETVNERRIEKLKQTLSAKQAGECMSQMTDTQSTSGSTVTARAIAADTMGVSDGYVGRAQQLERDAPELFDRIRDGRLTVTRAWRTFTQADDTELSRKQTLARQRSNAILAAIGEDQSLLDEFLAALEQLAAGLVKSD